MMNQSVFSLHKNLNNWILSLLAFKRLIMNIYHYLQVLLAIERRLAENFIKVAEYHKSEKEIYYGCQEMAALSNEHIAEISRVSGSVKGNFAERRHQDSMLNEFEVGLDLQADLRYLWLLTKESGLINSIIHQSFGTAGDITLTFRPGTEKQSSWLFSRIKYSAETVSARS
jgi:hypothetical protein